MQQQLAALAPTAQLAWVLVQRHSLLVITAPPHVPQYYISVLEQPENPNAVCGLGEEGECCTSREAHPVQILGKHARPFRES